MPCLSFEILHRDPHTRARNGLLTLPHGKVLTPAFMPVGTYGAVKGITPDELSSMGAQIILSNTYHLYLAPGVDTVRALGGVQKMMGWEGPLLTDSGGFQVFSLAGLAQVDEDGVNFRSHRDGSKHRFTPEISVSVQAALGVDIAMAFDECLTTTASREAVERSTARTLRWAKRSLEARDAAGEGAPALFGIVQGGLHPDLRAACATELAAQAFDGLALGGLSVGESREELHQVVEFAAPFLPEHKPRYLMGVGYLDDIILAVGKGMDLFDCVLPTRNARNGCLFTSEGRLMIKHAAYRNDEKPPDPRCSCYTCRRFSRGYLRHLFMQDEMLGCRLNTVHNLHFYLQGMARIREAIANGTFAALEKEAFARLGNVRPGDLAEGATEPLVEDA